MRLVFSNGSGLIENSRGAWEISALPVFSFECEGIFFDDFANHYVKHIGSGHNEMTVDECAEVALFILDAMPSASAPAANTIEQQQSEARAYLNSTDWYFARLTETGQPVPADVLNRRTAARSLLQ